MKYLCLLFLFSLMACEKAPSNVKYTVTGSTGTISADYVDGDGIHEHYTGASPWEDNFSAKSGANLSISGGCGNSGTSEVHIYVNGVDKAHDTELGTNASAVATVP